MQEGLRMQEIVNIINSVGFPILCVLIMFKQQQKITEDHKAESDKWQEALMNNTIAINKLITLLDERIDND